MSPFQSGLWRSFCRLEAFSKKSKLVLYGDSKCCIKLSVRCCSSKSVPVSKKHQRPPGGGRTLDYPERVFHYNNWDNVVWDEEQEQEAQKKVGANSKDFVSAEKQAEFESEADRYWNDFYNQHQNRFFKDRHWLFTEFPELAPEGVPGGVPEKAVPEFSELAPGGVTASVPDHSQTSLASDQATEEQNDVSKKAKNIGPEETRTESDGISEKTDRSLGVKDSFEAKTFPGESASYRILEVGCGVGNTVFPVLQTNNDPGLFVYCCDFSKTAIDLVKEHADYSEARCHSFVHDVTDEDAEVPFPEGSLDVIVFIFVLSAIHPDKMQAVISRLASYLKPGGTIVFRDYGRYDLAQLRFKNGRCLSDNFYARGDGTRVYFFTQDELRSMFTQSGLEEVQNLIDRRLQVNRGRQLKMYRVWIQCKYRKPLQ